MKIRIYFDDTIPLDVKRVTSGLTTAVPSTKWEAGSSSFATNEHFISNPKSYSGLSAALQKEIEKDDFAFLFTEKPYDNNYFFDSDSDKITIVSLYGWDQLTNLHRSNGIVYFTAALLVRKLQIGRSHRKNNTGCINDFWQDKSGVDAGMRAAYICSTCSNSAQAHKARSPNELLKEISTLLDYISHASRANEDILEHWERANRSGSGIKFDVFLCHNSKDKDVVRLINRKLKERGILTWLDEEQLPPGRAWQELLEQQIESIGSVAVFVGPSGFGPWQDAEMRAFISEFVSRRCPVIPVILRECSVVPQLPLFMRQFTWVDFRKNEPEPFDYLMWGITGNKTAL
jgi:hypothetical protein